MTYPSLFRRYIALWVDLSVILALLFAYSRSRLYHADDPTPVYWPLVLFVLYEPLLTAYFCTVGQFVVGTRVRLAKNYQRVPLWRAFIRLVVKDLLGVFSFFLLPRQKQRRALHDLASGTIMLEASDAKRLEGPRVAGVPLSTQERIVFRDLTGLVKWLKIALAALAVVSVVYSYSSWLQIDLLDRAQLGSGLTHEAAAANDTRELVVSLIYLATYSATAFFFLRWTYLVKKNVIALGGPASKQKISPGWAVGYYFIPFLNLWKPYQALKEAFEGSHSEEPQYSWSSAPRPRLLPLWWTLWIVDSFVGHGIFREGLEAKTIDQLLTVSWAQLLSVLIDVPLIVVVWVLISTMLEWQTAKGKVGEPAVVT